MDAEPLVVEQFVQASPETVFSFFSDSERWVEWQGLGAVVEPWAGGRLSLAMAGGRASGRFVEVVPHRRVVFTWGWEGGEHGVPAGSSTVEVELIPTGDGTLVRLTHRDLPGEVARDDHRQGWTAYLARLAARCEGRDPGPDPMAA